METASFIRDKLTEWGLSEFIQRFEDEGIDKDTFLSLGDSVRLNVLIAKIGPRVKFRKRLREYFQMETCHFVQNKLAEWDLSELIQTFEEEGIDKETFLSLEESGSINVLIPQIGPRVKFRKRLREYLQALETRDETPEMMETNSETEFSTEMDPPGFLWNLESTSTPDTESGIEMA
ncbi:uncharacterized protein LOC118471478 isoform X2 [Amphiprion ocellaris]|uniref:uncharacterized protein LOC118471478 isoform X2 n=1 Tax=Amphiprion ocellaris TaxID=80972 RepID=UPI001649AC78|nr:uncharacterized protein LOC118471478 isoform X2 [Amphiprion ocellaris]